MIDWNLAGAVTFTGLTMVFTVLIVLILIVSIFGKIFNAVVAEPSVKTTPVPPTTAKPTPPPAPVHIPVPAIEAGITGETVAAISAAIYTYMEEVSPGAAYVVTNVSQTRTTRPVWGFAGMQQNTRPF